MQGGEGIIGDLGPGGGHGANQGGLAGVGHPQQPHIGDDFQFQPQIALLAGRSRFGLAGGAVDAAFVAGVAQPVKTALGDQQPLPRFDQIADQLLGVGIVGNRADRNHRDQIRTAAPGAITCLLYTSRCV